MTHRPIAFKLTQSPDIDALMSWLDTIAQTWQQTLDRNSYSDKRSANTTKRFLESIPFFYDKYHLVKFYATQANTSSGNLASVCRKVTGLSPSVLIHLYLLKEAILLLDDGEYDINMVGFKLGFNSHSHFTTFFKSYCCLAPTDYRKMMAESKNR